MQLDTCFMPHTNVLYGKPSLKGHIIWLNDSLTNMDQNKIDPTVFSTENKYETQLKYI